MTAFRNFEQAAVLLLAAGALSEEVLDVIIATELPERYEYTGSGYFLTVKHPQLPSERRTLSDPPVVGMAGPIQAGFVVFLGDGELTLECHTWGEVDVPEDFRDLNVKIVSSPVHSVDLRR